LNQLQSEINEKNNEMINTESSSMRIEGDLTDKMLELNQRKLERIRGVFDVVQLQTQYKAFDSIAANKFRAEAPGSQLRQRCEKQREMNVGMIETLKEVVEATPQFAEMIQTLVELY